ncbi:MAG: efflux RND transporter periplasmic adaptor subunit [Pirellula sp.]|jgi:multidrug resistance efflux pump|nr:efflux RND transporter periplasmic adaptor subunit [Pirellula sp.]
MLQQTTLKIDQILDELDVLARSSASDDEFFNRVLLQLGATIGSFSNALVVPALEDRWFVRSVFGPFEPSLVDSIQETIASVSTPPKPETSFRGTTATVFWYAVPVSNISLSRGLVVSVYSNALSESEAIGLVEVQQAFCELVDQRLSIALERFFSLDMATIRELGKSLDGNDSLTAAARTVVTGLSSMLPGCRVSLSEITSPEACQVLAVSSAINLDAKSRAYADIQSLARASFTQKRAVVGRTSRGTDDTGSELNNVRLNKIDQSVSECDTLFLPFGEQNPSPRWIIGFEFCDHPAYVKGSSKLPYVLPVVETLWKQKLAWLDIPIWIRRLSWSKLRARGVAGSIKTAAICLTLCALILWMLKPTTLMIEAEGALMPSESKAVFASADGFVSTLLVSENAVVEKGQLLATLTSPSLDLQLEELRGKIRALEEESRGVEIAMNQLQPNTNDSLKQQSLMASKLKDIALQIESLNKQRAIVESQREDLEIRSPIQGIAMGKDLQQNLLGRPVNRGDLLFRVMDTESEWELRLNVRDLDSQYVRNEFSNPSAAGPQAIEFVLDGSPKDRHSATVKSIANRVENIHREGNFLEVRATTGELAEENKKVGSNVHAYFPCGKYSTWFVWFRPAIEAARRKLWF